MSVWTLEWAIHYATLVHAEQMYGSEPYILHPLRVMFAVAPEHRIVAVLHDVVEDGGERLRGLSDVDEEALALVTRGEGVAYAAYIKRLAGAEGAAGERARAVKRADLADHLAHDPPESLRARYEKALDALTEAQHP
jgi:hypothetical protein